MKIPIILTFLFLTFVINTSIAQSESSLMKYKEIKGTINSLELALTNNSVEKLVELLITVEKTRKEILKLNEKATVEEKSQLKELEFELNRIQIELLLLENDILKTGEKKLLNKHDSLIFLCSDLIVLLRNCESLLDDCEKDKD